MNLVVVIGAVVLVTFVVGILVAFLSRTTDEADNLTVADIQARLAREDDRDGAAFAMRADDTGLLPRRTALPRAALS